MVGWLDGWLGHAKLLCCQVQEGTYNRHLLLKHTAVLGLDQLRVRLLAFKEMQGKAFFELGALGSEDGLS